jgi:hypothetical protein
MSDQLGKDVPSETAQAWESVRRVREPVAWILLVATAIWVLVSALQLFDLASAPVPTVPGQVAVTTFGLRSSVVAPQFVAGGIITLPVLAVILVAFTGGLTDRARLVVQAAVSIQAVTLGLGVLSWLGALNAQLREGAWFIFVATDLAVSAAALIFTVAVFRSQALRRLTPQFEDFDEDDEDFEEDA